VFNFGPKRAFNVNRSIQASGSKQMELWAIGLLGVALPQQRLNQSGSFTSPGESRAKDHHLSPLWLRCVRQEHSDVAFA
jgi:hypothetical protein